MLEICSQSTHDSDKLNDFSDSFLRCYKNVNFSSFFPCTAKFWNSLSIEFFPFRYNLNVFKSRINRHLLTIGSF